MSQYGGSEYGNPQHGNPQHGNPQHGNPPPNPAQPYGSPPPAYGTPPEPSYGTPPPAYGTPPEPSYGAPPPTYGIQQPSYSQTPSPAPYSSPWMPVRSPESSSVRTQAITSMIINIVTVLFCCAPLGIAGAITSGIAIGRADTDVASAKRLVGWGWGLLAASVVLWIAVVVLMIAAGVFEGNSTTYDSSF